MIRIGIIGLGKMGLSHCAILGGHPEVEVAGVCDTSSLVIDGFKKYSSFPCYSDYKKMIKLANLDGVVIASPTKFHSDMVDFALENNIHVFCEKPFVLNAKDGVRLTELAVSKGLVNQVGYHNRYLGTFEEVKRLLENGILGEVYHFMGESYGPVVLRKKGGTWRSEKNQGGGCLYDYASHTIDLVHFLLGKPVSASGTLLKNIFSEGVEDAVFSSIKLENGLSGQLAVNWSDETHRKMTTQITVLGTEGKIIADATELKIYLKEAISKEGLNKGWNIKYLTDLTENVDFYLRGEEYSSQLDHFIACIKDAGTENKSSFKNATVTDEMITKLLENAKL
ncbi:Gfo/Idh/MocA family protein [Cyclobacterium roseum]|uniref:Gfo/Idh/MocA family protein n=1 Tax=Cyclobacterium roseum TaxID=2666137 RepID=UPI001390E064|nr:Gfo/Idh/MocA family oxidoreductase [Cyclobacterium roseum]